MIDLVEHRINKVDICNSICSNADIRLLDTNKENIDKTSPNSPKKGPAFVRTLDIYLQLLQDWTSTDQPEP
jgi:hypothetical protein